jgi:hypothetical protein
MGQTLPLPHHPALIGELELLAKSDPREANAIRNAIRILASADGRLDFPHTSAVQTTTSTTLRELRPRRGRSRHRVLFAPRAEAPILLAIAPEAGLEPHRFRRAVGDAIGRLAELNEEHDDDVCN